MTSVLSIHPENPQARLINQIATLINQGKTIAYPTDSGYALGCSIGNKKGLETITKIRKVFDNHNFTLVCANLSDLSLYAKVNNTAYRIIKKLTPGAYTFIFDATKEVPNRLQQQKRKSIGIRVPNNHIVSTLLSELGEPIMSVSLIIPETNTIFNNADDIFKQLKSKIDLIIDGGTCAIKPTTVIDFTSGEAVIKRIGQGDISPFE